MKKKRDGETAVAEEIVRSVAIEGTASEHVVVAGANEESNRRVLDAVERLIREDPPLRNRRATTRITADGDGPATVAGLWAHTIEEILPHYDDEGLRGYARKALREWRERDCPAREPGLEMLALTITATRHERTVLLVERLDELLRRVDESAAKGLRKVLQSEPSLIVVATAAEATDGSELFAGMTVVRNDGTAS